MPEWLWVWGANILNRSLRKEALSCKAWNWMMVWEVRPAHRNLQYSDIWKNMFNLSSVFSFITGYLAYCWLIICKANIILVENAVEKPQGPHGWHRVSNDWGIRTAWGNLSFDAVSPSLFKCHVIYVVLGATAIWYWNTLVTCFVTSYNFICCLLREIISVDEL